MSTSFAKAGDHRCVISSVSCWGLLLAAALRVEKSELELKDVQQGKGRVKEEEAAQAVTNAERELAKAETSLADLRPLLAEGFITRTELERAEQQVARSREELELAKRRRDALVNFGRPLELSQARSDAQSSRETLRQLESAASYRTAQKQAGVAAAQSRIQEAQARLELARQQPARCEVRAEVPGSVVYKEVFFGSEQRKPQVGDQVWATQPLIILPDISRMVVETKVRETDIHKVERNQKVYAVVWILMRELGTEPWLATLLTILLGLSSSMNWTVRPQMFAYPRFAVTLWVLWRWQNSRAKHLWLLPIITALWANFHGSFILAFVLIGSALVFGAGERKKLALWFALSLLTTLINPRGIFVWQIISNMLTSQSVQAYAAEWHPPVNSDWQMNMFFGWLLLFIPLVAFSARRLSSLEWVWFLGFGWLALSGLRYVIWFMFIMAGIGLIYFWDGNSKMKLVYEIPRSGEKARSGLEPGTTKDLKDNILTMEWVYMF